MLLLLIIHNITISTNIIRIVMITSIIIHFSSNNKDHKDTWLSTFQVLFRNYKRGILFVPKVFPFTLPISFIIFYI